MNKVNVTPEILETLNRQYKEAYNPESSPIEISAIAHNFYVCGMDDISDELNELARRRSNEERNRVSKR